ncbi:MULTISPECIES: hypothetical protein [unclassified Novosphingobium]|uniref:hypothetical protein n=1 Tax=unclassified Novosphingobium TaxID=2644732 RepID=UPI00135ADDAC|nr:MULTISPECIES: hypothetical protein [unclassified Novosphingobium]
MTDDQKGELAGVLAHRALMELGDPLDAMLILFQAASALCITRLSPPAFAVDAYDGATVIARDRLVEVMGATQVRN